MANPEHLEQLKQGVTAWNAWRMTHPEVTLPDLRGADLNRADLSHANLRRADLSKADLQSANLSRSDLREVNLTETNLTNAILIDAHLAKANLSKANLSSANLWWANLWSANLTRSNLADAELWHANLTNTDLSEANLERADLTSAVMVETNLKQANLAEAVVYGIAAWNVNLEETIQTNPVITPPTEPRITVDDLEIAQFIYLLLNHQKLRSVLNTVTERGVLILGRFGGGGLDLLHSIAGKLREMKYLPIIFDFERPASRDYTETVKTLVGLSRFVIVDLSVPSVPQELYASVPFFDIPFVPIIESGRETYSMFRDLFKYSWVLKPPVEYTSKDHLLEITSSKIVAAAEEKHKERQILLEDLFPHMNRE